MQPSQKNKASFLSKLNTFRVGLITGFLSATLVWAGASHTVFNVLKFGQVTFGANSTGQVGSPRTETNQTTLRDSANSEEKNSSVQGDRNTVAQDESQINQEKSNNDLRNISAGGDVNVTISYKDNSELPGFNPEKGYSLQPPDIGKFNDAILISNVSFGGKYFKSETRDIFIQGKK